MHCALAAMHIDTLSVRALETRMHEAARALQVGATATFLIAALLIASWYRCERPPSDDWQHLPFILEADAVVNSDARAMPEMASNRIMASRLMVDLLD
jgi:hypothetical protein